MVQHIYILTSRLGKDYYRNLEDEEWIFSGDAELNEQYEVYRQMRAEVKQEWRPFNPRTNILWLRHLVVGMLKGSRRKGSRVDKAALEALADLKDRLTDYPNCRTFVKTDAFFK